MATICVFQLKSLKQGQSRSLLTQAGRHHAAQLNFFRKRLNSLEVVEPHIREVAEQQHIDYQFSVLEDDDGEDVEIAYDPNEDRELSFDHRANEKGVDVTSASENLMEVDEVSLSFSPNSKMENSEVSPAKSHGDIQVSSREPKVGSHSAPIFLDGKLGPAERVKQMLRSSTSKSNTYVLPTPNDSKFSVSSRTISSTALTRPKNVAGRRRNLWHSSPLEQKKHEKDSGDVQLSEFTLLKSQSVLKKSNSSNTSTKLPPLLSEGPVVTQHDSSSEAQKIKRKSVSGP